jgi:4-amino-4-deoxy-L-arabinose transferase-like glycosyltransferase
MTSNAFPATGITDTAQAQSRSRARRLALSETAWGRIAFIGVTAVAAVLYLTNLSVSGYANSYYSAAALAASQSWSAWFFGSFDAANFITVDKPPLATMLMGLSVRLFGLNSWSVLLPEALCGIATVALLFLIVRRHFGTVAATIAALVTALTPAAVLIFRYNNPDALLTLLLVLAAGSLLRGLENGRIRWAVLAAILVGFAFNTKYLQAWLVLPAFAITWFLCAPGSIRRRIGGLLAAFAAVVVSSGWWVLAVELIPAGQRPYIGGSTNNSALDLLLGYDGLGRIFGQSPGGGGAPVSFGGSVPQGAAFANGGPGGAGGGFGGVAGLWRMFNDQFGGQVAWLIPFSLIALVSGLAIRFRAARTDVRRAAYLLWGLWLVVHLAVFSLMSGIIHSYYVVVLAPAMGALVGMGAVDLWRLRGRYRFGGLPLAIAIAVSSVVAWLLLSRIPDFVPGLDDAILIVGLICAAVVATPWLSEAQRRPLGRIQLGAAAIALVVLLLGPAAYAAETINTAYSGGDPAAGPSSGAGFGGPGGFGGGTGSTPGGLTPGAGFNPANAPQTGGLPGLSFGGPGAGAADSSLIDYLLTNRGDATWIVATTSSQGAGSIELASGAPVMAMGGFSGSDPAPSLAQLQSLVASGQLRYVLLDGNGGPGARSDSDISTWIRTVGTVVDYGGSGGTLYDLSGYVGAASGS